jgi:cell division protein FtsQ
MPVRNKDIITELPHAQRISFTAIFMAVFCIVGFYVMSKWAIEHFNKPISIVKVEGNFHHLTQQQVATVLEPYVDTDFLSVDLDRIQQAVGNLPWVSNVTVRRIWPEGIAIRIKEEMAIARWGDKQLLDEEGRVFSLNELNEEIAALPVLNGPQGHEQDVMKQYQYIGQLLRPLNRRITHLTLAERGAWELQLNDGMKVMLGKERLMEKIQRFIRLYDAELAKSTVPILVVDVRYSNGIAVRWGSVPTETESTQKLTDVKS